MALYAIGDIQGCYRSLQQLLDHIQFNPGQDQLWFVGDLVNRGPDSLNTLRFIKSLGEQAICVLGNHDLHLLAVASGHRDGDQDTFQELLSAPDFPDLINWLRKRPIMHHDLETGFILLHAGLPPQWDLAQAKRCAAEVEQILRGDHHEQLLANLYHHLPNQWSEQLTGWERLRFIVNCFTRIRYCDQQGRLDFTHKQKPGKQPRHLYPWFQIPHRKSHDLQVIFGHWAALGHYTERGIYALDSGCVWGEQLTAMKIGKSPQYFHISCSR